MSTRNGEQPLQRKIKESMDYSRKVAEDALNTGTETLARIRSQGAILRHANDNMSPLTTMTEESNDTINVILKELSSGRGLFFICAIVTIIIIFLVIRWKHSK